jgi:hypothetical protein
MFENRMLRRIFGPRREEVEQGWRRLHNEELHNLYMSPNNITSMMKPRRMRWADHEAHMREMRNAYKIMVRKCEGKRPLGRHRHR